MKRLFFLIAFLSGLLLLRYFTFQPHFDSSWIQHYNDKDIVTLHGQVLEPPQIKGQRQEIVLEQITIEESKKNKSLRGKVLVKTRAYPRYHFGDALTFTGKLEIPPEFEDFSYKNYLAISGIYSLMDYPKIQSVTISNQQSTIWSKAKLTFLGKIYRLRSLLESIIDNILPEPQASLLAGILFGIERDFEPEFYKLMQKAGVLHIIVASGFNIMVVAGFFLAFSPFFGRKLISILASFGILIYAIIAGFEPPVVRAMILGGGAILANSLGRRQHTLLWLIIAAYLMLLYNPLLYKSVSFQLSFLAAFAILVIEPRLRKFFVAIPKIFRESLSTTLSVQILTLPVIWFNFHEFSLAYLLVNALVLETIPLIMGIGLLSTFVGLFNVQLAQVLAWPVWLILTYFLKIVELFGGL